MTTTYEQFVQALEYLVSIEPDPELDIDYDEAIAPYAEQVEQAYATIKAYGEILAPSGLSAMGSALSKVLHQQTDLKSESLMRSNVNALWHGIGQWQG